MTVCLVATMGLRLSLIPGGGWSCWSCMFSMGFDLEKRGEQRVCPREQNSRWTAGSVPPRPRPTLHWRVKVAWRPRGAAEWLAPGDSGHCHSQRKRSQATRERWPAGRGYWAESEIWFGVLLRAPGAAAARRGTQAFLLNGGLTEFEF